ncbi:MAG TPA: hypothetical protein PLD25_09950 [Chloroflexota bacterium]|nr:hypothetical protein [Chloroflexota bacterium]
MSRIQMMLIGGLFVWCLSACRFQSAPEFANGRFEHDHYVYIGQEHRVQIYDIADPDNLHLVATWETPGRVRRIITDGNTAYVVHWPAEESWGDTGPTDGGIQLVNVRQPTKPRIEGYFTTHTLAEDLVVHGDVIYASDWENVYTLQHLTPQSLQEVTRLPQGLAAMEMNENLLLGVWGGCSFRSGACQGGLWLADVSGERQTPVFLGEFIPEQRPGYDVALLKTATHRYALVAGHGLWVVDVSNPTAPQEVAFAEIPDGFYHSRLAVKDNTVILASDTAIRVYDVSQPERPLLVGQMAWHSPPLDLMWAVEDDLVYVATWDGLAVVDVSDRQRPFLLSATPDVPIPPPQPTTTP